MQNDRMRKNGKRKYRVQIMGAVASESGIGPDKLLLFNFLHERCAKIEERKSNDIVMTYSNVKSSVLRLKNGRPYYILEC